MQMSLARVKRGRWDYFCHSNITRRRDNSFFLRLVSFPIRSVSIVTFYMLAVCRDYSGFMFQFQFFRDFVPLIFLAKFTWRYNWIECNLVRIWKPRSTTSSRITTLFYIYYFLVYTGFLCIYLTIDHVAYFFLGSWVK